MTHPKICAAYHPRTNEPIMIRRGETGYYPAPPNLDVDSFNVRHGVSSSMRESMIIGSMFGWDVPGADPDLNG